MTDNGKTKKKPKDPHARVRKLGSRQETIVVKLTEAQIEEERHAICENLNRKDEIDRQKAESAAQFKAQSATVDLEISRSRGLIAAKSRHETVEVEEWLTESNEVMRVRSDTGEILGETRRARSEELQEKLFPDTPTPAKPIPAPVEVEDDPDAPGEANFGDDPEPEEDFAGAPS